jgi:hypothetical protein
MLKPRWTYSNLNNLTKWYGHVDYYGQYVIGQWFALNADTGTEYWSRRFFRPTTVFVCKYDVIVASETRSDGPWTGNFGIYGIDAKTGNLLWTNHGRGIWGKFLRCLDYVPKFTNEFRDVPIYSVDQYVFTERNRTIDIRTGREFPLPNVKPPKQHDRPDKKLYQNKSLEIDGDTVNVEGVRDDFMICRRDKTGHDVWRFAAKDCSLYVAGNYYSYRLHYERIYIVVGDAPNYVPINDSNPWHVKPNPANYQMGIVDVSSGEFKLVPLLDAMHRKECRIEAICDSRILVSCDGTYLVEYEIAA